MPANYTIALDYGTNSVRTLIVNVADGVRFRVLPPATF